MSFVIRQIAKRADGGDIIRTRSIDVPEITVGRGTDCDIQLPDLGVMLRHARLSLLAGGLVAVEATGGIPLEIGGKFLNRAELDVAGNPVIDIASHRLTLSRGEVAGSIAITAERVVADAGEAASETGVFSLRGVMPGKRGLAWAMVGVVLLAFLALPLWVFWHDAPEAPLTAAVKRGWQPDMVWTSGPLSTAHAGLANNCGACHQTAFVSVTDSACVACHTPDAVPNHAAADRMAKGRLISTGFEANVHKGLNLPEGRCASCHKEHEGPQGALMVAERFCTDCHTGLSSRLLDTGIADVKNWATHPQFKATVVKAASVTAPRFERVLMTRPPVEQSGLVYPHDVHLSATNSVANMVRKQGLASKDGALACNYCHVADSDGVRFRPIEMEKNCGACHDLAFARDGGVVRTLPHGKPEQVAGIIRDFYAVRRGGVELAGDGRRAPGVRAVPLRAASGEAALAGIFGEKGVCSDCHAVVDSGAGRGALRYGIAPVTLADHYLPKGDFVHKRHETYGKLTGDAACVACHKGVTTSKLASDVLLPKVEQCRDCHGSAKVATNVPATCDTCHGFHYGEGVPGRPAGDGRRHGRVVAGAGRGAAGVSAQVGR